MKTAQKVLAPIRRAAAVWLDSSLLDVAAGEAAEKRVDWIRVIPPTYYGLRLMSWLGLIRDLRPVPARAKCAHRASQKGTR